MPFVKSLPADAGPGNIFTKYADIYRPWSDVSQALMNGPSPLTPGEREMIAAYVVGVANCRYAYAAHTAAAYAWGIEEGLIDKLLDAGANMFRLNFSHGDHTTHAEIFEMIRAESAKRARPVGIIQDLQGPKLRVGRFADGAIELDAGMSFALTCDDKSPGDQTRVGVSYTDLYKDVDDETILLLNDGKLALVVLGVKGKTINTKVLRGGEL